MDMNPCRNCALAELQVTGPFLNDGYYRCAAGCEKAEKNCEQFVFDRINKDFDI